MEFKIGDEVELAKNFPYMDAKKGEKAIVTEIDSEYVYVNWIRDIHQNDGAYCPNMFKPTKKSKPKKKPYWVEVEEDYQSGYSYVMLKGKNRFDLSSDRYDEKSRANQQAKRLAKNLGLEFRQ